MRITVVYYTPRLPEVASFPCSIFAATRATAAHAQKRYVAHARHCYQAPELAHTEPLHQRVFNGGDGSLLKSGWYCSKRARANTMDGGLSLNGYIS